MKRLQDWSFYALCGCFLLTIAWGAIGLAIGLSVPSLRNDPEMPLWYVLPLAWGLALSFVFILAGAVLWALERSGAGTSFRKAAEPVLSGAWDGGTGTEARRRAAARLDG